MRKIVSKHDKDKKNKRNQFILGGILIFVMFFSVLGYSFGGGDSDTNVKKVNYNGFEFIEQNDFWFLDYGSFKFIFKYNPEQVEEIDSELDKLNDYYGVPLYVSSENNEAELEIYRNLNPGVNPIVQRMQPACLEKNESLLGLEECDENLPIKTCEDNLIIIKESNNPKIVQKDNCVFIEGPQENLTRITDEFLFNILGITQ